MLVAGQWLEDHLVDAVLLGGVDEYCDVLGYCWQRFFGSTPTAGMQPLNWDDQSAVAGEGAAFFVLTRDEGTAPRYGVITDIQLGHNQTGGPQISKDTLLVLGADGHKSSGMHYAQSIPDGTLTAAYTPLYGSLPTGPAFDLAIAALSISEGKIFTAPAGSGLNTRQQHRLTRQSLDSRQISCLKFDCEGQFGLITLTGG
jgi:3-oxoacyl-[acyl-carrier-protein] synthase II